MNVQRRATHNLRTAVVGVLVVALALIALEDAVGRSWPAVAGSPVPDTATLERLTHSYFDELPSSPSALPPTSGQKAAILAAQLLLGETTYYNSLPLVTK